MIRKILRWMVLPPYHYRELTKKDKRQLTTMIYWLTGIYVYSAIKNFARDDIQGPFGFMDTVDWVRSEFKSSTDWGTKVRPYSDELLADEIRRMKNQLKRDGAPWSRDDADYYDALCIEDQFRRSGLTEEEWDARESGAF